MKTSKRIKVFIVVSIVLLLGGAAAIALAHGDYDDRWGRHMGGYGGMMGPGDGYGYGRGYGLGYGPHMRGYGPWGNLSDEDRAKVDQLQESFFKVTRELRGQIDENQVALRNEMDKDNPDQSKVMELQKKLSGLQAQLDQKQIEHQLELKKLLPEDFREGGFGPRSGRGPGYCW